MSADHIDCEQCDTSIDISGHHKGRLPKYCSKTCKAAVARIRYAANELKPCSIDGCTKNRNQQRTVCNTHAMRLHRYGDYTDDRTRSGATWTHSHGYQVVSANGHPLAQNKGQIYVHRKTLWDAIGAGPHNCHWCSTEVEWMKTLEVDHLDSVTGNNDPSNLVPACHACNTRRGAHRRWHINGDRECNCEQGDKFDAALAIEAHVGI